MKNIMKYSALILSFLIFQAHAGVVNYYTKISGFSSSNDFPQGEFVDGLQFNSSMTVNISGTTDFKIIYVDSGCSTGQAFDWKRYLIIPESVKDSTGLLTIKLNSNVERFLVGIDNGVKQYAYLIDEPNGLVHSCVIGGPFQSALIPTNTTVNFQSSLTKKPNEVITAKIYQFQVPVRVVAFVNGTSNGWYSEALALPPIQNANIALNITNYCTVSQSQYEFNFGSLTEEVVNKPGFSKESDTKNLGINCVEPANISLSIITASNENGNQNKVKMGNDLIAEFYLNGRLENNLTLSNIKSTTVLLNSILRKSENSTKSIESGDYTGTSVIRIKFD